MGWKAQSVDWEAQSVDWKARSVAFFAQGTDLLARVMDCRRSGRQKRPRFVRGLVSFTVDPLEGESYRQIDPAIRGAAAAEEAKAAARSRNPAE